MTPAEIAEHGLTPEEYDVILTILGRAPNLLELGVFSVMWSEHCSYKSSRKWLKTLPTEGDCVIQGPGENAGVVDIGDGLAAIFKIESHNHPSYIEPYQGAATGVGGILRDVFTMGARPIANLNALRFGDPQHPKMRHLISGVVAGIAGYGNSIGVPTVGGECNFDPSYNGNILVNAMTVGIAVQDRIFYAKAAGVGNPVIYVGAGTGRDGIHGATMASAEFSDEQEAKRPTVQVGDPFTEKRLLEACLELMRTDMVIAIQDMGAAGLTSSSVEMSNKGGLGIQLWLDKVPMREQTMTPYELMLSESQERMLMVLTPGREDEAAAIFKKWELEFAHIGVLTDDGRLDLHWHGEQVGLIPLDPLVDKAPCYDRPYQLPSDPPALEVSDDLLASRDPMQDVLKLIGSPDLCSRRWIYEQYDYLIGGGSIITPGGNAAVVRLMPWPQEFTPDEVGNKALAVTVDCTPRYCAQSPKQGAAQAVVESWRNLTACGATPLAITNNLNYGNPERETVMGTLVAGIEGIGDAAKALNYPVISGNVSLYNETDGTAIAPTPVIGGVGLIKDYRHTVGIGLKAGWLLFQIGDGGQWLGQSLFARNLLGLKEGAPPPINYDTEERHGAFVRDHILAGSIKACHDLSDGGLLVAITEMALAGACGVTITCAQDSAFLFGEDQARYVIAIEAEQEVNLTNAAAKADIPLIRLGNCGGDNVGWDECKIPLKTLRTAHESWFPNMMQA